MSDAQKILINRFEFVESTKHSYCTSLTVLGSQIVADAMSNFTIR